MENKFEFFTGVYQKIDIYWSKMKLWFGFLQAWSEAGSK